MRVLICVLFLGVLTNCATGFKKYDVDIQNYEEVKLANGMTILYMKDDRLPVVSFSLMLKSGSASDPTGKTGLSVITAELLEKGSETKTADETADAFAALGTSFSSSVDYDYILLSTNGLSSTQNELIALFSEVVQKPKFLPKEVKSTRREILASIRQSYDEPSSVADRAFARTLMANYPYGRTKYGTERDVRTIRAKHVTRYYQEHFRPNNAIMAVTGDISEEGRKLLESSFQAWENRPVPGVQFPKFPNVSGREFVLVHRSDLKQSEVRIGHGGIARNHPDYMPLRIANIILGGNFTSRLMSEIRNKRGLTYGVSSYFDTSLFAGPFGIQTATRHDKVGETVTETLRILEDFREKGITDEELETARSYLMGNFVRALETPESVAYNVLALRLYGVDEDYLENFVSDLSSLTKSDVNAAIKRHIHPDHIKVLVYSKKNAVLKQLRPMGAIEVRAYKEFL